MHDRLVFGVAYKIANTAGPLLTLVRDYEAANVGALLFRTAGRLGITFILEFEDERPLIRQKSEALKSQIKRTGKLRLQEDHLKSHNMGCSIGIFKR